MKKFNVLLITLAVSFTLQAQTFQGSLQAPRPKVGVVLGGGGAKGASHIGVLKYLEEMGIPVDYVAGTSMGSIIGGLYAMGYSPDELAVLIANMNWSEYVGNSIDRSVMSPEMRQRHSTLALNIPFGLEGLSVKDGKKPLTRNLPSAYVSNTALINLFNDLCIGYQEDMNFNDLPIPFACVATDIATGNEVVIQQGSVPTAMRASMAIPGVFSPVLMNHQVLVDGGLVNNFPADVLLDMGADIIIGVEVSDKLDLNTEEIPSLLTVFNCLVSNAVSPKRAENRKLCNVYMAPDITGYGTLSFTPDAIDTLVNRGYKKAKEYHEQLAQIKLYLDSNSTQPVGKQLRADKAKNLKNEPVFIHSITMNQCDVAQSRWLTRKGGLHLDRYTTFDDIDHAVNIYRGTGAFNDITYNILEDKNNSRNDSVRVYDLIFNFNPTPPHVIGIGSRYDTEEGAALLINLGINEKQLSGAKLNLTGRLSYNPRFNLTATYALLSVADFNMEYNYRSQHFKVMVQDSRKNTNLHFVQSKVNAYVSQFHLLNVNTAVGFSYASTRFDQAYFDSNTYDTIDMAIVHSSAFDDNRLFGPYLHLNYDNLDDAYFARRGLNAQLDSHLYIDQKNTEGLVQDLGLFVEGYLTPRDGKLTIIPQFYSRMVFGKALYANLWNAIGGEVAGRHIDHQKPFIGVSHVNETCDLTAILRCDLRYNFYGKHYLTAMYNFMYGIEGFGDDDEAFLRENYSGLGLRYAYDSPIGPISLTSQWSDCTHRFSMFFSLGYIF
ncbi:MAG: patatin-like phospholipase family protein [Bacteroidales bacterium]|nr:patatin-like phospholipase family protein [Bacteroidales bacterium]